MASSDYSGSPAEEPDVSSSDVSEDASDADASDADASDADASDAEPSSAARTPLRDATDETSGGDAGGGSRPAPDSPAEPVADERPHEIQAGEDPPAPSDPASDDSSSHEAASTEQSTPPTAARIPEPVSPAEGAEVDEPSVTFEWEQVEDATNYELQVARDRTFDQLVFEGRVGSSSRFTYSGLPPQEGLTLYWRVRAHIDPIGWTEFGTIGTFVLADWRPAQPNLAQASGTAPAVQAQSSRAEPILIVFSIVITTVAVGLAIIYMQDLAPDAADETTAETTETAEADTVNLDALQPRDDGTYRIPITTAMERVVERTGGTWDDGAPEESAADPSNTAGDAPPAPSNDATNE